MKLSGICASKLCLHCYCDFSSSQQVLVALLHKLREWCVQTAAAVAAQALLHSGDARWYKTKQAPGPDDVNWSALWCSSDERLGRRMLAGLVYFLIMCIPLGAFAGILTVVCFHKSAFQLLKKRTQNFHVLHETMKHVTAILHKQHVGGA